MDVARKRDTALLFSGNLMTIYRQIDVHFCFRWAKWTLLISYLTFPACDTDSKMHTSRYAGYVNGNRDYITDGEESHRAPSDRTVSEYIVANERTTMVMYFVPWRRYSFTLKRTSFYYIGAYFFFSSLFLTVKLIFFRWNPRERITRTGMTEKTTGDPEARTILATRYCPDLRSIVCIRFAKVPRTAAFVTMVQIYMSPALRIELLPT